MLEPAQLALLVEPNDAELGTDRKHCRDAELGGLLYDQIHGVGLYERLQQHDARGRFRHGLDGLAEAKPWVAPGQGLDARNALLALPVEDDELLALAAAQHAAEVMSPIGIDAEGRRAERRIDEEARGRNSRSVHSEGSRAMDYSSIPEGTLIIDPTSGWLSEAAQIPSPNCDERPAGCEPSLIVIHGISLPPGEFGGPWIDALFTNSLPVERHAYFAEIGHLRVSSHALIRRDGEVRQYVPFTARAWHAGQSSHCGRTACNDFSVGIELEGTDEMPYTDSQYERLVRLVAALRRTYASLRDADIVGHEHIAPGRKTDPGPAFDWKRFFGALEAVES